MQFDFNSPPHAVIGMRMMHWCHVRKGQLWQVYWWDSMLSTTMSWWRRGL